MIGCLRHKNIIVLKCERDSSREWDNLHPGAKNKQKQNGNKYTRVQIVHFYRLLQVDVFSKTENSLGYIGRKVNSLTELSSLIFSSNPGEVNC